MNEITVNENSSRILHVHCLAHIYIASSCPCSFTKKCALIHNALNFIYELIELKIISSKQLYALDHLQMDVAFNSREIQTPSLRTICPTCWTVGQSSINSAVLNYKILLNTLDEVQHGTDDVLQKERNFLLIWKS